MTTQIQEIVVKAIGQGAWAFVTEFMKQEGIYLEGTIDQADGTFDGILHTPVADVRISGEIVPKGGV